MPERPKTRNRRNTAESELTKGLSAEIKDLLKLHEYMKAVEKEVKMITGVHKSRLPSVPKPPTEESQKLPKTKTDNSWNAGLSWDLTRFYHEAARDYGTEAAASPDFWDISELPDPAKTGGTIN